MFYYYFITIKAVSFHMEKDCAGNCLTISILRVFFKGLAEFPITQTSALTMTCFKSPAFVPLSA